MTKTISSRLEKTILQYIKETYLPKRFKVSKKNSEFTHKDIFFFAKGAAELSDSFTINRSNLPKNYFNKKEYRSAYLLYFTLTNYAKTLKALNEAYSKGAFDHIKKSSEKQMSVLDLGCGPGTASIACSTFFEQKADNIKLDLFGVDQNNEILNDAKNLFSQLGNKKDSFHTSTELLRPNLKNRSGKKYDLIIAANFLNEIGDINQQFLLCESLIQNKLKENGTILMLDIAIQKTTRMMMELRDRLIGYFDDSVQIVAPCLHRKPCPMLAANRRDWCHFYLEWSLPDVIKNTDSLLGIKHNYLKMTYLTIQKTSVKRPDTHNDWKVVSSPLPSKGKTELLLCNNGILKRISRLDRDYSKDNCALISSRNIKAVYNSALKRGDIINIIPESDRILKDTQIVLKEKFND